MVTHASERMDSLYLRFSSLRHTISFRLIKKIKLDPSPQLMATALVRCTEFSEISGMFLKEDIGISDFNKLAYPIFKRVEFCNSKIASRARSPFVLCSPRQF